MKTLLLLGLLSSLALSGCVRRAETDVAGSDEEILDRYAARLEELGVRLQAQHPECAEVCTMNREGCDLAQKICEIAARQPNRLEVRCASAQEECAKLGDACISCRRTGSRSSREVGSESLPPACLAPIRFLLRGHSAG